VTGCLVPWNSGGAYQSATLGVATLAYLPFAFFNWLSPLVTLIYGWLNITIHPIDEETKKRLEIAKQKEEAASESA
jgi:NhaC family Na+:H+ antiporter